MATKRPGLKVGGWVSRPRRPACLCKAAVQRDFRYPPPRPRLWCWGPGAGLRNFERFDEPVVLPKEIK